MTIQLVDHGTSGELLLKGRLDSVTAPEAEPIFRQTAERFDKIVLNMAELDYISSAGLRLLKIVYMQLKKKNGDLTVINVNKMIMEVFEMVGFVGLIRTE